MSLAIFDLDNTLIAGDSDYLWAEYLIEHNLVDKNEYQRKNHLFYQQYLAGTMDIFEFSAFQFQPFADYSMSQLLNWRRDYLVQKIDPIILPAGKALIAKHQEKGDTLLMITATNRFITEPIAEKFGIQHLIATEPAIEKGEFNGLVEGTPSYRDGKVIRLKQWLSQYPHNLKDSTFYSDSHNDLPLLEFVNYPIAVDPDRHLLSAAQSRDWKVISLRN